MSDQDTSLHETSLQATSDQETALQETSDHTAPAQPSLQATSFQVREAFAAASQAASSKITPSPVGSATRKRSSPRFGFGGTAPPTAAGAETSPTPAAK